MKNRILFTVWAFIAALAAQAQVTQINSNKSLQFTFPLTGSKAIFVSGIDERLWVTDGTLAGTVQLSPDITFLENVGSTGVLNGKFIFSGSTATTGAELYITDGTPAGTILVKDINPGTTGSFPDADAGFFNGFIYFTAERPAEGRELWRTDGTPAGTTFVKDIVPGTGGSNYKGAYHLFSTGTYLLFMARTPASGVELWRSDGTGAGTVLLKDINTGADSSGVRLFIPYNNLIFFSANDGVHGNEIWKTDGTAAGTVLLKDINPGSGSSTTVEIFTFSYPLFMSFHIFNNRAFFNATDGTSTGEIWGTDGTSANTTLLKDVVTGTDIPFLSLTDAVNYPGKFIFPVADGTSRSELWQSNGTTAGTTLFKSFSPVNPGETPVIFVPYNAGYINGAVAQQLYQGNKFFFEAGTTTQGNELWVSDGTLANTAIVKDIYTGELDGVDQANLSYIYTSAGLYFAANNGTNGNELWKSDGTSIGTTMVADINTGIGNADPSLVFFIINSKILFGATNGDDPNATDLYAVNGNFSPVPLTLLDFKVMALSDDALLQWNTSQELNSKDFTIQRSYDGVHFENIGIVAATGTSATSKAYTFKDIGIIRSSQAMLFYRLWAEDIDGKGTYSKIVTLKLKGAQWDARLLENPVSDFVNIVMTGAVDNAQFSVIDFAGKTISCSVQSMANGNIRIPVANLPHGSYVLVIKSGNAEKQIRFIK